MRATAYWKGVRNSSRNCEPKARIRDSSVLFQLKCPPPVERPLRQRQLKEQYGEDYLQEHSRRQAEYRRLRGLSDEERAAKGEGTRAEVQQLV